MKLFTFFFFLTSVLIGQSAEYGKLNKKGEFEIYITKNGDILKAGDSLIIGVPISDLGFTYISQGGQRVSNMLSDKVIVVDKLKTYGSKMNGYKMYAHFKGYGLLPVLIDYETAIEVKEVKNPKAKLTREEAILKLKEANELLDLKVISKEDYNKLKMELTPIITD